jgi:hypothetical protein
LKLFARHGKKIFAKGEKKWSAGFSLHPSAILSRHFWRNILSGISGERKATRRPPVG